MARPSRGERESIALRRKNEALDRPMRLNRSFTDISDHSNRPQVFTGKGFLPGLGEISRTEQYIRMSGKNKLRPPLWHSLTSRFADLRLSVPLQWGICREARRVAGKVDEPRWIAV